jgi:hypothetical protein
VWTGYHRAAKSICAAGEPAAQISKLNVQKCADMLAVHVHGAAFDELAPEYEVARVLKRIVAKLESGITEGSALDTNGNRVAIFKLRRR